MVGYFLLMNSSRNETHQLFKKTQHLGFISGYDSALNRGSDDITQREGERGRGGQ